MDGFHPETSYGPDAAQQYDEDLRGDEEASAAFLAKYARGGAALEFAIGTGRIALPLAEHAVRVDGIELSPHMVTRLREKDGGILTHEGQVECFRNATWMRTACS